MPSSVKKNRRKMRKAQKALGGQIIFDEFNMDIKQLDAYFTHKKQEAIHQGDGLTVANLKAAHDILTHGKR